MKALSFIALMVALVIVFMLQEKTIKTTLVDKQAGQNKTHQIENDLKAQLGKGIKRLEEAEAREGK